MKTPVIGIILDSEDEGSFSPYPYYALRKCYFNSVAQAGGLPIALPYVNKAMLKKYFDMIDGLLIPGGGFDIPPQMYGDSEIHHTVTMKPDRTNFEAEITKMCLDADKPILGVCGGMQLINVVTGGSLHQDIPTHIEGALNHKVKDRKTIAHKVKVKAGTLLHKIVGDAEIGTNTSHHQAIKQPGKCVINAYADDGIVEGLEIPEHKFCLGVQWHPEHIVTDADFKIIKAFVDACR